jgi:oligopeptide transport system substrate-binding protein
VASVLTEPARGTVRIRRDAGLGRVFVALAIVVGVIALGVIDDDRPPAPIIVQPGAGGDGVTVLFAEAHTGLGRVFVDTGSASVVSQLFESVTTFDPGLNVRPALAESWDVLDGGRRIVFHLRPDGRFSDGTPITGDDVVRSWLRVIAPDDPSTLAGLFDDVEGAVEHRTGTNPDPASVGLRADGYDVEVRLKRPAAEFPAIIASPTFAVVPPGVGRDDDALQPGDGFVASGAYRLVGSVADELTLEANEHYWAGPPAIPNVRLLTSLGGRSPVAAFENDEMDYGSIGDYDASWIRFNKNLGPNLREVSSLTTTYYGFDTRRLPFDDSRVRQAFALAIDWERLVRLAGPDSQLPANSMVPPGIPGRSDEDFTPPYDPEEAQRLLAEAGYPGGAGFPDVTLITAGDTVDEGILSQLHENLGIDLGYETMDFSEYFTRLEEDAPAFWSISWSADYPGRNDFLGLLLGSGQTNNYGGWSNAEFDAAIAEAGAATDEAAEAAAYDRAERIVQREVPVVPSSYGTGWALSHDELLGADQNGLGILRLAGLAWDE